MHFLMNDNSTIRAEFGWVQLALLGPFERVDTIEKSPSGSSNIPAVERA